MADFDIELVGKIGSMALIDREYQDMNYNIIARLSRELRPGYVWVTSGATEIGRLDYIKRTGRELIGTDEENKTDYSAQGQSILMQTYRQFIDSRFSVRQILVEHQHFNDEEKRAHLYDMLCRCPGQNAIPIINYNDPVSYEENRKHEIGRILAERGHAIECVDNDETASQIACLVKCKTLLILTTTDGRTASIPTPTTRRPLSPASAVRTSTSSSKMSRNCSPIVRARPGKGRTARERSWNTSKSL